MRTPFLLAFSLFIFFTAMLWTLPVDTATAAGLIPCGRSTDDAATTDVNEKDKCTLCHLIVGINRIVVLVRDIMSAFAVVVVVAMAFVYITSAGDEGRMRLAKEGITAALIGFAIILLAWLAVNFILKLPIFSATAGLVRVNWDTITCDTTSLAN